MLGLELDAGAVEAHALGGEVARDVLDLLVVAAAVEPERGEAVGISLGVRSGEAEMLRRPKPQELAAARAHLERHFLIVLELALETLLAVLETRHGSSQIPFGGDYGLFYREWRGGTLCTLVILRRPGHRWPLILGANRDEMIDRPWQEPGRHWPDRPEAVAGRDALAGGSWLGVNDFGVVAAVLNRHGSLGPAPGQRSRGELVLEALDHADARDAAAALAALEPRAYRTFNLVVADNRDAFWLRHADPSGTLRISLSAIGEGLSMLAAGDINDETPRIARYRPLFARGRAARSRRASGGAAWERLLCDGDGGPESAMRFQHRAQLRHDLERDRGAALGRRARREAALPLRRASAGSVALA